MWYCVINMSSVCHDFSALKRHCGESLDLHGVSKWPLWSMQAGSEGVMVARKWVWKGNRIAGIVDQILKSLVSYIMRYLSGPRCLGFFCICQEEEEGSEGIFKDVSTGKLPSWSGFLMGFFIPLSPQGFLNLFVLNYIALLCFLLSSTHVT